MNYTSSLTDFNILEGISNNGNFDPAPDLYSFNFGGYSGKFYISDQLYLVPHQNLKVEKINQGNAWKITTPDGTAYFFEAFDEVAIRTVYTYTPWEKVTWHLTKIVNQNGVEEANFIYENVDFVQDKNKTQSITYAYGTIAWEPCGLIQLANISNTPNWTGYNSPTISDNQSITRIKGKQLKQINTLYHKAEFLLAYNRKDYDYDVIANANSSMPYVTGIKFRNENNQLLAYYHFNYSYYITTGATLATANPDEVRLKLTSIVEAASPATLSSSNNKEWTFQYNTTPLPSTKSYSRDFWGYYNGRNNLTLIPSYAESNSGVTNKFDGADRRAGNLLYMSAGILNKIIYPTGGEISYEYETNKLDFPLNPSVFFYKNYSESVIDFCTVCGVNDNNATWSNEFSTIINPYFSNISTIDAVLTAGFTNNTVPSSQVAWNGSNIPSIKVFETDGFGNLVNPNSPIATANGIINSPYNVSVNINLPVNKYFVIIANNKLANVDVVANIHYAIPTLDTVRVGGLRLKSIKTHDGISSSNDIIKEFEYFNPMICDFPKYEVTRYKEYYNKPPCPPNPSTYNTLTCSQGELDYITLSSNLINPLGNDFIGYGKVRTKYGVNGIGGYEEAEFSNFPPANTNNWGIESDQFWRRGQLLSKKVFDNANVLKQEFINEYDNINVLEHGNTGYLINKIYEHPCADVNYPPSPFYIKSYNQKNYLYLREFRYLKQSQSKQYFNNGTLQLVKQYEHNNPIHVQTTKDYHTNSDGNILSNYTKYVADFNPIASSNPEIDVLHAMNSNSMGAMPVLSYSTITKGSDENIIAASLNLYKKNTNGAIYPYRNYVLETSTPLPVSTDLYEVNTSSHTTNIQSLMKLKLEYNFFNNNGLVEQVSDQDGISSSIVYNAAGTIPLAQFSNAKVNQVYYENFEEYSGAISTNAKYGLKCGSNSYSINLAAGAYGLPPSGKYILQWWEYNGSNWTFKQEYIQYSGAGTLPINTTASLIDEVVFYPEAANFEAVNLNNKAEVIAKSNASGLGAKFQFDALGRLEYILDHKGNILSKYEYNYLQND